MKALKKRLGTSKTGRKHSKCIQSAFSLTHLKVELAVAIKAKKKDLFGQDLLTANDKVQSRKETGKDD